MNVAALVLALAMTGQCYGPACQARFRARPVVVAPVVVVAPPAYVAPTYITPTPPVPVPVVCPSPVPLTPIAPPPTGCRYIWNGYMWVTACY